MNMSPLQRVRALRGLFYTLLVLLPVSGWAVTLKNMDVNALPDEMVELKLTFDGAAPNAHGYIIEKPPRISLDLPFTRSALPKYNEVGLNSTRSITVLETGDRTRLVINLEQSTGYSTKADGNTLSIYLGAEEEAEEPITQKPVASVKPKSTQMASKVSAVEKIVIQKPVASVKPKSTQMASKVSAVEKTVAQKPVAPVQPKPAQTTSKVSAVEADKSETASSDMPAVNESGITRIDFQRGEDGEGKVIIALADAKIPMDMNEQAGRIRLEFAGDVIPEKLRNRLDVIDFATPVMFIDSRVEDGNSSIVIEPKGQFEYLAYQTDNLLTISVKKPERQDHNRRASGLSYKGDKLSLNFQNIEVRAVLQLIADFTDLNLVASDTVGGNVTLRLQNVPWDQALDIVLKAKGLDKRLEGNVLTVAPAAEIAAREREQLENEQQISELAPVYTDLVQINYADAAEISEVIQGSGDAGLLTERGSVQVVDRTNSLLVKDTQAKLDELRDLIEQLDIPIRQVMIEARIVTLSSSLREELGVKWSGQKAEIDAGSGTVDIGGRGDDNIFTDLSVTGVASTAIQIGLSTNSGLLNLELSALLSDGGGEVISQPKVITADKKTAIIKSGKEIPYEEKTSSGATSVAFKDAVLGLEVTPQITPDGRVIMDIKINNDDTTEETSNSVPIISTNEITTQVLVEDGETVVLGGVFKQSKRSGVSKVPVLGDIPYIGALFRSKTESDEKEELLVFITPRVVTDSISLR